MARLGRPKTDLKYEHLTIRCPEGLLDQWREAARRHDRSLNAEIIRALRRAIETEDTEQEHTTRPHAIRGTAVDAALARR